MLSVFDKFPVKYKRALIFSYDGVATVLSFVLAIVLRYGEVLNNTTTSKHFVLQCFIILATHQALFISMGQYKGIWRYASTFDLKLILKTTSIGTVITFLIFFITGTISSIPRSILFIQWTLNVIILSGGRFVYRMNKDSKRSKEGANTLIVGAGSGGEQLIREIQRSVTYVKQINVIGFVDDDTNKFKRTIHGTPILGKIEAVKDICNKRDVKKIFIAIPSATSKDIRNILSHCPDHKDIEIKVLPNINQLSNDIHLSDLRAISPADLLSRTPIKLDQDRLGEMLNNKVVMISGAGGSIGSELCHQVAKFNPSTIILFEISEFNLYEIERKLKLQFPEIKLIPIIGSVCDRQRIADVFKAYSPNIVYHAAAYKHVPLMEDAPMECIQNNVWGTKILAEESVKYKIEKFVMVSTDKAVNPTNVMGATKRASEMICQLHSKTATDTQFSIVRFGNVLGSRGSVIPLFKEQIENGGPVTVTHKDITRYFMSIPEASQLIIQAGSQGIGGEIFVLDMGEPVKIINLAEDLIKLAGLKPHVDIEIKVTGLRPGEKLYEELFNSFEECGETIHPLVRKAKDNKLPDDFEQNLKHLIEINKSETPKNEIKIALSRLVKNYSPEIRKESNILQ